MRDPWLKKIVRENVKLRNKFCDKKNFIKSFFFLFPLHLIDCCLISSEWYIGYIHDGTSLQTICHVGQNVMLGSAYS